MAVVAEMRTEAERLLGKAAEHLAAADGAYWDQDPGEIALHLAYAQAAASTACALVALGSI